MSETINPQIDLAKKLEDNKIDPVEAEKILNALKYGEGEFCNFLDKNLNKDNFPGDEIIEAIKNYILGSPDELDETQIQSLHELSKYLKQNNYTTAETKGETEGEKTSEPLLNTLNKQKKLEDKLITIAQTLRSIDKTQREQLRNEMNESAKKDPNLATNAMFQIQAQILDSQTNFILRKSLDNPTNLKDILNTKNEIANQKDPLKKFLEDIYKNYEVRVTTREKEISNGLPLYMIQALGGSYDNNTGNLTVGDKQYNLFDIKNGVRSNNPKLQKTPEGKIQLTIGGSVIETNKQQTPTKLDEQTIYIYIGLMQLDPGFRVTYEQIHTYIYGSEKNPTPKRVPTADELKSIEIMINMMQTRDPINRLKYGEILTDIKQVKSKETQEKEAKTIQEKARNYLTVAPSLERANKLFSESKNRPLANEICRLVKNGEITEPGQQDNFVGLIQEYTKGVDIKTTMDYTTLKGAIKTGNELPYNRPKTNKKGEPIYLIVLPLNNGKTLQLFPGTMEDVHDYRAQNLKDREEKLINDKNGGKTKICAFEVYDNKTGSVIDLENTFVNKDFKTVIEYAEEVGSYKAFAMLLEQKCNSDSAFLKNNIASILSAVKEGNKGKEAAGEHMDGYYKILAQQTINILHQDPSDLTTLQAYLSFIKQDPSNIGSTKDAQINNRNILATYGDIKIKNNTDPQFKEIQDLYLECKRLIDPNGSKDLITQIGDNVDKFFETFGPIIAKMMDLLGYDKASILKRLPSDAIRAKFLDQFEEANQMTAKQKENFGTIAKSINIEGPERNQDGIYQKAEYEKNKNNPSELAKELVKDYKNNEENIKTIKQSLQKNFTLLSPGLVQNLIATYNKNHKDTPITESNFIVNGKVKADTNPKETEALITQLLDAKNPMWNSIITTHNIILSNTKVNIGSDKEPNRQNINRTTDKRSIETFTDVTNYLAAYVVTFDKPPFKHAMTENNIDSYKKEDPSKTTETQTKNPENLHKDSLASIKTNLTTGKYNNGGNQVSFPEKYTAGGGDFVQYETQILTPIQKLLAKDIIPTKVDGKDENESAFSLTAKDDNFLNALKDKPQVLKDLITYTATTKEGTEKNELEKIAKLLEKDGGLTVDAITLTPSDDKKTITVQIGEDKKFTITPGPEFKKVESST